MSDRNIGLEIRAEAAELRGRIDRLDAFIATPSAVYDELPMAEKLALNRQLKAMRDYLLALQTRISLHPA